MSRIETNLLTRIESSNAPRERAILCARLAIYYFHKGDCAKAQKLVGEVRDWARTNEPLEAMVYINLAEATDLYQSAQTGAAILKTKRAFALSSASREQGLVALCASWLARLYFDDCQYANSVKMIALCLRTVGESEPLARTRCYTLVADVLSFCGKSLTASPWYAKARAAAVEEGDEIAIGQIIYNTAVFRFNNVRLAQLRGEEVDEELRMIELMIGSSSHYDVGVKSSAFKSFLPMLNAQLMMLRRDYKNSSKIFSQWLQSSSVSVDTRLSALCRADFALVLACLGDQSQALDILGGIDIEREAMVTPDDAAIIFAQCSAVYSIVGDKTMAKHYSDRSAAELGKHGDVQSEILSLIASDIGDVIKE